MGKSLVNGRLVLRLEYNSNSRDCCLREEVWNRHGYPPEDRPWSNRYRRLCFCCLGFSGTCFFQPGSVPASDCFLFHTKYWKENGNPTLCTYLFSPTTRFHT